VPNIEAKSPSGERPAERRVSSNRTAIVAALTFPAVLFLLCELLLPSSVSNPRVGTWLSVIWPLSEALTMLWLVASPVAFPIALWVSWKTPGGSRAAWHLRLWLLVIAAFSILYMWGSALAITL